MIKNRIVQSQADYLFLILRKPEGWEPTRLDQVPPSGEILSEHYVASYAEAYDDMIRCNRIALERNLDKWSVIQHSGGSL